MHQIKTHLSNSMIWMQSCQFELKYVGLVGFGWLSNAPRRCRLAFVTGWMGEGIKNPKLVQHYCVDIEQHMIKEIDR